MSPFTASLSAAEAYTALDASYDTPDLDLSGELMDRAIDAPIATRADADAKIRLLAALLADNARASGADPQASQMADLGRQLEAWVDGVMRMSPIISATGQERALRI